MMCYHRIFLFASFLLAWLPVVASQNNATTSSRLMIHIPHSLKKETGYAHREALFGVPHYGGSIAQNVYYADSELCDPNTEYSRSGYPTRSIDKKIGKMESWPSPFILMVDRGDCTFVQKVRNAQRAGAAGVIIADTTCLCSDTVCLNETKHKADHEHPRCEMAEPIMADDGSGSDISIPSFLMFKHDADKVKAELKQNHPVQIEMAWSLPSPDDRVEYDLWTVPVDDLLSSDFVKNFKIVAKALGDRAYFTPHMYIYDGMKSGCHKKRGDIICHNLCTNHGRYCSTDPDNDVNKGISGANVVTESLRRMCIWNHYGAFNGIGEKWWDYVAEFLTRCNTPDYFANEDCIKDAFMHSGIDKEEIDRCMEHSGGLVADNSNTFLDIALSEKAQRGVVLVPSVYVNTAPIRGALSAGMVFRAICAGYAQGSIPDVCRKCSDCIDPIECILSSGIPGQCTSIDDFEVAPDLSDVTTHTFFISMLIIFVGFGGLGFGHYKKAQDELRNQVRGILAEYMPMEEIDPANGIYGGMNNSMGMSRAGEVTLVE